MRFSSSRFAARCRSLRPSATSRPAIRKRPRPPHRPHRRTPHLPPLGKIRPRRPRRQPEDIPTLTLYPATHHDKPTAAVIVAPGGSYHHLAANHEGRQIANWFNAMGIAAFVLQYRLGPRYHHPIELGDAQRAVRLVRSRAKEFNIDPARSASWASPPEATSPPPSPRISTAGNASDSDPINRENCRPDFVILAYPVISMTADYSHKGSAENLLGNPPDPALAKSLSNELNVTSSTPPTFLFSTSADTSSRPKTPSPSISPSAKQSPRRNAHLRKRPARRRPGSQRRSFIRVGNPAEELAARPRRALNRKLATTADSDLYRRPLGGHDLSSGDDTARLEPPRTAPDGPLTVSHPAEANDLSCKPNRPRVRRFSH